MERKLATVLFVDLVDSTGLVSSVDPEVVRRRVTRYFEQVAHCIEKHGGIVEKFAGDAVMAAFGIPRAHEDDAERAARAAFAVLDSVRELGLEARLGLETGEVVVEEADSTFATGEAVNIAARLQQAAAPGEIRLGPGARRLAAGILEVDDAGPVAIREGAEPLWTWRAVRVVDWRPRRVEAPFVGREHELDLLANTYARAVHDQRAHLVTVFGEPGIGKTRLVTEFVESVERATVLTGRALPYGEGVTYWPLASMVKASAGISDDDPANSAFEKLRLSCESEAVADLLAVALGVLGAAEGERTSEQLSWATRRWAEQLADAQPLVLVFEDVHWAEDPLLDLIEHLARSVRSAPLLVVAAARSDLLTIRPSWGGGIPRATAVELTPLDEDESEELADALLEDVPPAQRALVLERAEGNPLFLEEMARMLGEEPAPERIPETVQALIAARIDALDTGLKHALQCASVVGRVFWRGALERLCPEEDVAALLDGLLEREFIVPEPLSTISGDRAFQFKHFLIREVAYASTSKAQRAELHREAAAWIAERAPDELVEIRAHHLDQAACLLRELEGEVPEDLAHEAAAAIDDAGRRALRRGSFVPARRLVLRADELEPTLERRYLAAHAAWRLSNVPTLRAEVDSVLADARAAGDPEVLGQALVLSAEIALHADNDAGRARELADEALGILPQAELGGRYDAHSVLATIGWWIGDADVSREHIEAMIENARATQRRDLESLALAQLAAVANAGGDRQAAHELTTRARTLAEESGNREALGFAIAVDGRGAFGLGDYARAGRELRAATEMFEELGAAGRAAWSLAYVAAVESALGNLEEADRIVRDAVRRLRATHDAGYLVEAERTLAEVLLKRGRVAEAERVLDGARRAVGRDDVWTHASVRYTLGKVRLAQERPDEAAALFGEAYEILAPTMYQIFAAEVHAALDAVATAPAPS